MDVSLSVGHHPHRDLLLDNVDPVVLHRHLMHVPYHTVPISGLFWSKLSKSVSRHDSDSQMLPPASALRPNPSLLAVRAYTSTHPLTTLTPAKIEKYTDKTPISTPAKT